MALHRIMLPNKYFPVGTFVESFDGVMQEVETTTEKGRLKLGGYKGVCIPEEWVRPYTITILYKGLDTGGAFNESRRAGY